MFQRKAFWKTLKFYLGDGEGGLLRTALNCFQDFIWEQEVYKSRSECFEFLEKPENTELLHDFVK